MPESLGVLFESSKDMWNIFYGDLILSGLAEVLFLVILKMHLTVVVVAVIAVPA